VVIFQEGTSFISRNHDSTYGSSLCLLFLQPKYHSSTGRDTSILRRLHETAWLRISALKAWTSPSTSTSNSTQLNNGKADCDAFESIV